MLVLECRDPVVRYTCRCNDGRDAERVLEALACARSTLEQTTRSSQRRASLAPLHAQSVGSPAPVLAGGGEAEEVESGSVESLVSTARPSGGRRRSRSLLADVVASRGSTSRRSSGCSRASAVDTEPASTHDAAAPVSSGRERGRGGHAGAFVEGEPTDPSGEEDEALDLYSLVGEDEPPGLFGLICPSDEDEDSSDSSATQSDTNWEDC